MAILREALQHADPDERVCIAIRLIRLGSSNGVASAIRLLDSHPQLRDHLNAADPAVLAAALRQIVAAGHSRSILRSIEIVHTRARPALVLPLLPILSADDHTLRNAVAALILHTTVSVVGSNSRRATPTATADNLDQLIAGALNSYHRHRCPDVLVAAGLVHDRAGPALRDLLEQAGTPVRLAVQGVPRQHNQPVVRKNLVRWMNSALLGRQAGRALHEITHTSDISELLTTMHLLLCPARRRMMRHVDHPARCLPDLSMLEQLPDDAQRHLPRFVTALPITAIRRTAYCADLIAAPSPTARWRALEVLQGYRSDEATRAVYCFARDSEPIIAGVAASHVFRDHESNAQVIGRIARTCPHAIAASRARVRLAAGDPSLLAEQMTTLTRPALLAAAHQLADQQPRAFADQIRSLLQPDERDVCLPAIYIVRRLGLVPSYLNALHALTTSDDPTICSAAVSAIADAPGPDAAHIVTTMLRHRHVRVRANAIEGLAGRSKRIEDSRPVDRIIEVVLPHTLSRHNRERANALRVWIENDLNAATDREQTGPAINGLRDMLRDPNPMHRISAIWVAGRSRQRSLVDDLTELARVESADPVRHRAVAALHRLTSRPVEVAA